MEGRLINTMMFGGSGSETDQPSQQGGKFFVFIRNTFEADSAELLKKWNKTKYRLGEAKSRRRLLLCCRRNDGLPKHITNFNLNVHV